MSEHGIIEAFAAQASRHPDRLAIADPRRGETATFAQLMKRAERFAGGLRRAGFATGDRLLLAAPVSVDFYALALAAAGTGVTIVLIDGTLDRRRLLSALRSARVHGVVGTFSALHRWWLVPPLHHARRYAIDGTALGVR